MPIELARNPEGTLVVVYCFGNLTEADVVNSLNFAFGTGQIEPGLDRIVTIDPATELHELGVEALRRIQRHVLKKELGNGTELRFRSVLVHSSPMQRHLLQLYKAIWDEMELPQVRFSIVPSEDEAWRILGLPPTALRRGSA